MASSKVFFGKVHGLPLALLESLAVLLDFFRLPIRLLTAFFAFALSAQLPLHHSYNPPIPVQIVDRLLGRTIGVKKQSQGYTPCCAFEAKTMPKSRQLSCSELTGFRA
jgi:hypothetical protein